MQFIIKLFPEITIKSKPVRKRFVKQLQDNLRKLLKRIDEEIIVKKDWDKIDVETASENTLIHRNIIEVLSNTPGIANFIQVKEYPLGDFHDIYLKTKDAYESRIAGKTFVVRCKRTGHHDFKSIEVERYVGGGLNQHTDAAGVKVKGADVTVKIEIRHDRLYVVDEVYSGLGGFPLGTQDAVVSLLSGGFDSAVASYLTTKRGLRTHFCFFNLGGSAHEVAVQEVAFYLWRKYGASHRVKFISVPFEGVVEEILTKVDNSQMGVILKRMFLRAASKVAENLSVEALVTGEAVAQVSSQTLRNLSVIDSVTETLVLRPLITTDKQDIIDIATKIGTEDFSKNIPEYCGVISVKPTTKAKPEKIEREEEHFDFSVLDDAIENAVYFNIDEMEKSVLAETTVVNLVDRVESPDCIIDIRHPTEEELKPLDVEGVEILHIPFYSLKTQLATLDQTKSYFLYCDKGVMSQIHATHLSDEGCQNIGVYRP